MVFKEPKDKWARFVVRMIMRVHSECDSYASINGACMTARDRDKVKSLCEEIGKIMERY